MSPGNVVERFIGGTDTGDTVAECHQIPPDQK